MSSLRADTGRGCRSSSSVGGGNFSGRIRCLNDTGSWVSDAGEGRGGEGRGGEGRCHSWPMDSSQLVHYPVASTCIPPVDNQPTYPATCH